MRISLRLRTLIISLCAIATAWAVQPSGSLPVITINTENGAPIADKTNYVKATYAIDPMGHEDVEALTGTLQIRGRGNYTWDWFAKKPYKLKLDSKAALLGYKKSKHFVLLAHADDNLGFMREPMGFRMSELAGMAWTPGQKPVELIINGDYRGLYFLVENIRIDKDRVDIFDQEDEEVSTDVTGGWLCELDNYEEDPSEQIWITEGNGDIIRITHHAPEVINKEQEDFLRSQMTALDRAFYIQDPDSREYENLVDLESLVNFYVLQELMDGQESFHGSCYIHRDRGQDKKWVWGPVWDFGNTYGRAEGKLIYESPDWGQTWIDQIVKFKSFQQAYRQRFVEFLENDYEEVKAYVTEYAAYLEPAAVADLARWPSYGNKDIKMKAKDILAHLNRRIRFLGERWGIETGIAPDIYVRGDFNGWGVGADCLFDLTEEGIYVLSGKNFSGRFKIADTNWSAHNWGTVILNQDIPLDTPVELIHGGESKDMVSPGGFKNVIFKVLEPGVKATVELSTKETALVEIATDDPVQILVKGREISVSRGLMGVYDISGRLIASDVDCVNVAPGIYIIRSAGHSAKIMVK